MKLNKPCSVIAVFTIAWAVIWTAYAPAQSSSAPVAQDRARVLLSQSLPKLAGDHLKAILVEVHYGPGEASPPHSHPCAVIGYMVRGAVRTQSAGGVQAIYRVGQTFYEAPNVVHLISANASKTEPAAFLAYFVCDHDGPLSVNVPPASGSKEAQQ